MGAGDSEAFRKAGRPAIMPHVSCAALRARLRPVSGRPARADGTPAHLGDL